MKCCINVISLILYQLLAVIILKPEGVFDCKMFLFFVFFVTKRCQRCVFFFFYPKLTYTGVPLHICTDVKRKWGKMTTGG